MPDQVNMYRVMLTACLLCCFLRLLRTICFKLQLRTVLGSIAEGHCLFLWNSRAFCVFGAEKSANSCFDSASVLDLYKSASHRIRTHPGPRFGLKLISAVSQESVCGQESKNDDGGECFFPLPPSPSLVRVLAVP